MKLAFSKISIKDILIGTTQNEAKRGKLQKKKWRGTMTCGTVSIKCVSLESQNKEIGCKRIFEEKKRPNVFQIC